MIKLLLLGGNNVGKTSILSRFHENAVKANPLVTIGADFRMKTIELDGEKIQLQIWDTAGHERFNRCTTSFLRGAMGIILVYDITNEKSLDDIRNWFPVIEKHAPKDVQMIILGNMCDMGKKKRQVSKERGEQLAIEHGIKFMETSAKASINVAGAFLTLVRDIKFKMDRKSGSRAELTDEATGQVHRHAASMTVREDQSKVSELCKATDQVQGVVGPRCDREDQSKVCEPCKVDNMIQPATGWCETCDELLCNDCYKIHCRLTITRNHQLRSLEDMRNRKQTKGIANKCMTHEGKRLKYYCEDHAELGCNQCFVTKHRPCRKVVCISEVATRESNEFKALQLLLSKLEDRLNIIEEKMETFLSSTRRQHDETITAIQEAGEKLKTLIDTLVKDKIAKACINKDENIGNMSKVNGIKKELEEELTTARDMIVAAKGDNTQLYITMKHLQGEANVMESMLDDSEQKTTIKEYGFVLNPELARLLDTMIEFGSFKDVRVSSMDKASDEVVDEHEVRRFQERSTGSFTYGSRSSEAKQTSGF